MSKLSRRKFKITKTGYAFMLITLGMGIAGLNTGNNLLYLLFGMMLSFIVLSGILSDSSMRRLSVKREVPQELTANAYFPVKITLKNDKRYIPSYSLSVEDVGQQQDHTSRFVVKVPAMGTEDIFYFSRFAERGLKKYSGFKVLTKYPFGLIQKADFLKEDMDVLVYPEIFDVSGLLHSSALYHGEYLSRQKGVGVNPWGLRSYQYGDDARLIHWKSTAKRGDWMIKEFESEKKMRVILDLNLSKPASTVVGYSRKAALDNIEKLISLCASMLIYLVKTNYEVKMTINGEIISSRGRGYITNYMRSLALLKIEDLPPGIEKLESPLDGESMHILMTNAPSGTERFVENLAMFVNTRGLDAIYQELKGVKA